MKAQIEGLEIAMGLSILIVVIGLALLIFYGKAINTPQVQTGKTETIKVCAVDEDCTDNNNGKKCIQTVEGNVKKKPFCGCFTNKDCKIGVCSATNICTNLTT